MDGVWWSSRSSKPQRPDDVGLGGFDSHTLPPPRAAEEPFFGARVLLAVKRLIRAFALFVLSAAPLAAALAAPLAAQRADSVRAGIARPLASPLVAAPPEDSLAPPISARRAFLYSFLLPGAGQAKLDRAGTGGMFFLIEVASLVLVHRSAADLRIARAFSGDSVPLRYQVDPVTGLVARGTNGAPLVAAWSAPRYDESWVRTRRLHYEDWLAVLFFNHLFAGADAFVAAQLWDLPGKVAIRATPFGPLISASIPFR